MNQEEFDYIVKNVINKGIMTENFHCADLSHLDFKDADIRQVDIRYANFKNANLTRCIFFIPLKFHYNYRCWSWYWPDSIFGVSSLEGTKFTKEQIVLLIQSLFRRSWTPQMGKLFLQIMETYKNEN